MPLPERRLRFFTNPPEKAEPPSGFVLRNREELKSLGADYGTHLEQRKRYFNLGGPWVQHEASFPQSPGKIYYRVMTLDVAGLEQIVSEGMKAPKEWDGQNVGAAPRLAYGVGNDGYLGDRKNALTVIFQLDGDELPWDTEVDSSLKVGSPRPGYAQFAGDIPAEAIRDVWVYDLRSETIHRVGARQGDS